MSDITFGGLTFINPDTFTFDKLPRLIDNVVVSFGSPLKDNDVALKFNKTGIDFTATVLLWDDDTKTAMEKWVEIKEIEGTLVTLGANGETLNDVVILNGGQPKKLFTDNGYTASFNILFRKLQNDS